MWILQPDPDGSSAHESEKAGTPIWRFVDLLGLNVYSHVQDTEYRLERPLDTPTAKQYILEGIVDVVSGSVSHVLALPYSTSPTDVEIWDYKSGVMPDKRTVEGQLELEAYEFQMRVYLDLYKRQRGVPPARAVLAFMGELGDDAAWNAAAGRPATESAVVLRRAGGHCRYPGSEIDDFGNTVDSIEAELAKPYDQQWTAPAHPVDRATCDACDFRVSCPVYPDAARQRSRAL
jgi:hypothetical protein